MLNKKITIEEWKVIKECGRYEISSFGNVRNKKTKLILKQKEDKGYSRVGLFDGKKQKLYGTHRLVAQAFIQNHDNKPQVNHINGIKNDNRVGNLEWCTASENNIHKFDVLGYKVSDITKKRMSESSSKNVVINGKTFKSMREASLHFGKHKCYFSDVIRQQKKNKNLFKNWKIKIQTEKKC